MDRREGGGVRIGKVVAAEKKDEVEQIRCGARMESSVCQYGPRVSSKAAKDSGWRQGEPAKQL